MRPLSFSLAVFEDAVRRSPLAIFNGDKQEFSFIPSSVKPFIISDESWRSLREDAPRILSAIQKVSRWLISNSSPSVRDEIFYGLSPLERKYAFQVGEESSEIATARLDLFFDGNDLSVIEVNTTIPAMQAYSDMVKQAFLRACGVTELGTFQSNTNDLLCSLKQHYNRTGGTQPFPRIGIVSRHGDSQLAELRWYQSEWQKRGFETLLLTPDEVEIRNDQIHAGALPIDIVYRHVFAHRLDFGSAFGDACLQPDRFRIFNPIAAHLEAKGVLAEASSLASDPSLSQSSGLSDEEREAILRRVAWSRVIRPGPTQTPFFEKCPDLLPWIIGNKAQLVVKSSFGYGGSGVFMGDTFEEASTQVRLNQWIKRSGQMSWADFVSYCAGPQRGQWIVQRKMSGRKIASEIAIDGKICDEESFVDCSIFTNSGVRELPSGGACRFASNIIVNIGRGGGVVPFFTMSEYEKIRELLP